MTTSFLDGLGRGYINEMLNGAPFLYKGDVYLLEQVHERGAVSAWQLVGDEENLDARNTKVPAEIFTGWKSFAFPVLGYRSAREGQVLMYMTRQNSVRRGLNPRDIRIEWHDVSHACSNAYSFHLEGYARNNNKAFIAMKPRYLSFNEGLTRIMSGDIPSFALSADFAVAPHDTVEYLEILFRQRRVGEIDSRGNVNIAGAHILTSWNNVVNGELTNE